MTFARVCLFIVMLYSHLAVAQTTVFVKEIKIKARLMTVDEIGNVYVVRNDNTIMRYNDNGDSTGFYKTVLNGEIGAIDATNPLRILVYYPAFAKVILLDRMLAPKNELDLRKINLSNATVTASSADGTIWVYDRFNARLKKVDDQLKEIIQSNDLRQEIQTVPNPGFMIERNWNVYLCDTTKGIFIFDRYGSFVNHLTIFNVAQLQVIGSTLVYRIGNTLHSWDQQKVREQKIALPERNSKILQAFVVRDKLYVLYDDELVINTISEN